MSESQERMWRSSSRPTSPRFLAICEKWDVEATVIGEVTDSGRLVMTGTASTVVDVPPRTVAHEGPVYERPLRPARLAGRAAGRRPAALPRPSGGRELRATLLTWSARPDLAAKAWVTDQYDRYVLGNTVLAQPDDAGMVRIDEETGLGVALATDGNGRYAQLDPYAGAQLALAEAYRNVAATGARPLAVTNCLNFGSPEDPAVMWQFAEAVRGLADGCAALGVPVTGGNVSFYNQTGDVAILPTPVVGVLGVIDDVARRLPSASPPTGPASSCSAAPRRARRLGVGARRARPPRRSAPAVDLTPSGPWRGCSPMRPGRCGVRRARLSDGGLAVALAESCLRGGSAAGSRCPGTRSPSCSANRRHGRGGGPARGETEFTDLRAPACRRRPSAPSAYRLEVADASRSRWWSSPRRTGARCRDLGLRPAPCPLNQPGVPRRLAGPASPAGPAGPAGPGPGPG